MSNIPTGKKIYLCTPSLKPITVLNGVDTDSVSYSEHLRDYSSLTFDVYENVVINGKQVKSNGYDELDVYMYLYLEDIAFFQMQYPSVNNDGQKEYKSITAYSIDKEWEDKDWVNFKCNTGEKDSIEQLVVDNTDDLGFTISFIKFYDPTRTDLSLLHIILEKMPAWSVDDNDIDYLLWDKKLSFSEDSINLYALMTSVIAPQAECVFLFDCLNRKIKAYHKDNLDFDTNIFIGFRNLSSQINQTVNEDSVFTRFNIEGGNELTISDWNYNNSRLVNLDYFLREPYMTEEQANKFRDWFDWQEDNREQFASYSQTVSDLESKIYTLRYMLPDDGTDIKQWEKMDMEELEESLKYYQALLDAFEVSVDSNPTYTGSDGRIYHVRVREVNGITIRDIVDENDIIVQPEIKLTYNPWTIGEGAEQHVDYDRYYALLQNMENGKSGYYTYYEIITYIIPNIEIAIHNYNEIEENQEDYIDDYLTNWELYGSIELEGKLEDYRNRLEALAEYAEADPEGDEEYQRYHEEYVEIVGYIGDENTQDTILYWIKQREDEIDDIGIEEQTYNLLRMQMVATVSMYDTEIIESESNEFGYDVIELDTMNPEWGFTEDDVKLYYTLLHDTDYTNENILTTSLNTTSTLTSLETVIQKEKELLLDSKEKLSEISQPQITFTVDMDNIMQIPEFEGLRDDCSLLRFIRLGIRDDYSVKLRIVGRSWNPCEVSAEFSLEFSNMITSSSGRTDLTDILNTEGGSAGKNSITIGSGNSDSDKEYATNLLSLMISSGIFSSAISGMGGLGVDEAQVNNLIENYIRANIINEASFNKIFSRYIDVDTLVADAIKTDTIVANIIAGTDQNPQYYMNLLTGALNMSTITADRAFINSVSSLISESMTSVAFDQYVYNAVANKISVGDLTAGDIVLNNNMRILSDNGMMIMNGTALQIYGEDSNGDPYVGIQLGYDTSSNPSLILRNEEGATILTPSGITSDAIADGLIINDMIHDNTISKGKLGFDIIEANEYGGVDITQIYDGSGNLWGVQYTSFKNSTESSLQEIENTKMYRVVVESDNGNIFKNGDVNCTLTCRVYSWDEEITDDINATYFTWTRKSKNTSDDAQWNTNHSGGRKSITLTPSDVYGRSVFYCTVTLPDGTVQSSG